MPIKKAKKKRAVDIALVNRFLTANDAKETEVELEFDNLKLNGQIKLILSPVDKKR